MSLTFSNINPSIPPKKIPSLDKTKPCPFPLPLQKRISFLLYPNKNKLIEKKTLKLKKDFKHLKTKRP
jgi:hypothetical protein